MSHTRIYDNIVINCDGDPRGGMVEFRVYPEGVNVREAVWNDSPRPQPIDVEIPFEVLANFVGAIAINEQVSKLERMTGAEFLGLKR